MPIHIHNSLKREKEEFKPENSRQITMYVCGPTVYDEPHIGHARSAYIFDVIRRYLEYRYKNVTFVRNVTDVDDKIIDKAKKEFPGEDLKEATRKVSEKYLKAYHEAMDVLGISRPTYEPKATEYIAKMVLFIEDLIKSSAAYVSDGSVYFDIKKAKNYGKLSNQSLDKMESGVRIALDEKKKDPLDFALWKKAKENEPSWDSPWGKGRPGWHIECSVMSSDILGDEFDIHGGGMDLIFPHHENEIAQSEGLGKKFARYWIHHGLLTINGQKMSKSLGNFITVEKFIEAHKNSDVLKLFFLSVRYSHPIDYTEEKIEEAKKAYEKFDILLKRLDREFGTKEYPEFPDGSRGNIAIFREKFEEAMDNDFNAPQALAVLFNMVNECNKILDDKQDDRRFVLQSAVQSITEFTKILGLSFNAIKKDKSDLWVTVAVTRREQFKKEKKYAEADKLRKELEEKGIILEDTKEGTTWRRKI